MTGKDRAMVARVLREAQVSGAEKTSGELELLRDIAQHFSAELNLSPSEHAVFVRDCGFKT